MNILDIIIVVIFIYCLLAGMHKGSIPSGMLILGFAGAWWGAIMLYPAIVNLALSNSTLMAVLNQYLEPATFFSDRALATTAVTDIIAGGEASISAAVASVGDRFSFLAEAFSANVRNQAFASLNITSLADYFNQTLWIAVFNVLAFVLAFGVIYIIMSLFVSMLDKVIAFPIFRTCDWLLGGVFGILRAVVVIALIITIIPAITTLISPEFTQTLISESSLYMFAAQFDIGVGEWIRGLVMG